MDSLDCGLQATLFGMKCIVLCFLLLFVAKGHLDFVFFCLEKSQALGPALPKNLRRLGDPEGGGGTSGIVRCAQMLLQRRQDAWPSFLFIPKVSLRARNVAFFP